MKNKLILIIILCLSSLSFANFYNPAFYLNNFLPIVNNSPDYYQIPMGVSINRNQTLFLGAYNQKSYYTVDAENQLIEIIVKSENIALTDPIYMTWDEYLNNSFQAVFYEELLKAKKDLFDPKNRVQSKGLIPEIIIKLPPMAMPRGVRKIMGNKAGRLNLSGTQKLTISASKTSSDTKAVSENSSDGNLQIGMKQDLSLNLNGSIGEKIKVDIKYNSNQTSDNLIDPNNIKIAYEGEEDEIVQRIDAGNTSLSLSGSRYIGVSASSQGLFGVKTLLKVGDLNITAIASKEESQKNEKSWTGSSQADSLTRKIYEYTSRTNYFLNNPHLLYQLFSLEDANNNLCPPTWVNNAIKTDNDGAWLISNDAILPKDGTVKLYIDNDLQSDNSTEDRGLLINELGEYIDGEFYFTALIENEDYAVDYSSGLITLLKTIDKRYTIGVNYTQKNNVTIGNPNLPHNSDSDPSIVVKALRLKNQTTSDFTWKYQARNIYSLGMQDIQSEGFNISIYTENPDKSANYQTPSELYDNMSTKTDFDYLNEFLRLDSDKNGTINGNDKAINLKDGYVIFPFLEPFSAVNDSLVYQEEGDAAYADTKYSHFMTINGKVGRSEINLGMMILPGSVKVKLSGKELKEGVDYTVDYDFGVVTFLIAEAKVPDADIKIKYENKPMFAIESKTLMGLRADWNISTNAKLGSTLIYQSEKISDKKPKIGNESRSLVLADIDGELKFTPEFMTSIVDFLPLIKTDAPSAFNISGEIAMNAPSIYNNSSTAHRNEAWLDDMESVLETYPLGTGRITWSPASEPYNVNMIRSKVNWFNPSNIYSKDVYAPSTLSEKEKDEKVSVLSIKVIPPDIHVPNPNTPVWGGLMKYIGNQVDFSDKEYIEFLVKVDSVQVYQRPVKMYVDMGDVSEDFYVDFGGLGVLNTEDGKNGGSFDGSLDTPEDIGLDGSENLDPNDTYSVDESESNSNEYPKINGTAGNGKLDTEDLSGSGFDTLERLFRYSVVLTDTTSSMFQNVYNGWYLYRIPLKNNPSMQILTNGNSSPDLKKISYVRVWFETDGLAKVSFINLDIIGNKWTKGAIKTREVFTETNIAPSDLSASNEYFAIETIDNQKNNHYTPPPKTTEKGTDGEISFEQALKVIYNNVKPKHLVLARQRFKDQYNLLTYNNIKLWVYPEKKYESYYNADSLDVIFRLGADSINYYEVTKRIKTRDWNPKMTENLWDEISFNFKDITYLKTLNETGDTQYDTLGITYKKIKSPTLTNIKEIAIGIEVPQNSDIFNGVVYFNELRVSDPNQNVGFAARTSLDTKFADFTNFKLDLEWKSADFSSTNSRTTSTTQEDKSSINMVNNIYLQKFFPVQWGFNLPLNLSQARSIAIPKYKANSDILRSNLSAEDKEREKNKSLSRSADIAFSLSKTPTNKILAYTVKNFSANSLLKETESSSSTRADTTISWKHSASYKLDIPKDKLDIGLIKNYKFYFFPKYFGNDFTIRGDFPRRWDYTADSIGWRVRPQTVNTKQIETANEIKYDIFTDLNLNWKMSTKRDLIQRNEFKNYNIGQETERSQEFQSNFDPTYTEKIFDFSVSSSVQYRENRKSSRVTSADSIETIVYKFDGNVNRGIRFQSVLKNSNLLTALANLLNTDPNKSYDSNNRTSSKDFTEPKNSDDKDLNSMNFDDKSLNTLTPDKNDFGNGFNNQEEKKKDQNNNFNKLPEDEKAKIDKDKKDLLDKENIDKSEKSDKSEKTENKTDEKSDDKSDKKASQSISPRNMLANTIGFIGRLQNISLTYDNQYGSTFEGRDKRPLYLYQLGLPQIIPNSELRQRNIDDTFTASSGFPIFTNLSSEFKYSTTINKRYSSANSQSISTTWPDIRLTLSGFETLIRIEDILSSSRISSAFTYVEKLSGDINWDEPNTIMTTTSFQPLIGFTGNWINNISTSAAFNKNSTKNITHQSSFDVIKKSDKIGLTGNIKYTFTAENGFKIPFISKRIAFKNQMESELTVSYENEISTTLGREKITDRDINKITFTPRATYNFHRNVKGGLTGNYDINKDNKKGQSTSIFSLDIWIEIQF